MTRWKLWILIILCLTPVVVGYAQGSLAGRLDRMLKANGVPVVSVQIGDPNDRTTWKVQPPTLQGNAQPIIDAFNPNDPALPTAEQDIAVKNALDDERLYSAIVWTVIDTYSPPATVAKYQAARTKIISAYKSKPWKP